MHCTAVQKAAKYSNAFVRPFLGNLQLFCIAFSALSGLGLAKFTCIHLAYQLSMIV